MDQFYVFDPLAAGSKGLVYVGDKIIVYRRSADAPIHPLKLDLPGGAPEPGETPFETFQREVKEEFGLQVTKKDIGYVLRFASQLYPGKFGYFPVAKLPATAEKNIVFGGEGVEWMLMTPKDFLARNDISWPALRQRTAAYLAT